MAVYISQFLFTLTYLIVIDKNEKIEYNKVLNPVVIFGVGYFIFVLIVRFGAIMKMYYYPSYQFVYLDLQMIPHTSSLQFLKVAILWAY